MFRRIVTYLVCLSIALHPVAASATNTELTVLQAQKAYTAYSGNNKIQCLDVKKGKSGEVHLAFDPSLHKDGLDLILLLDKKPVGEVAFIKGQLNFFGCEGVDFNFESPAVYQYPELFVETKAKLRLTGGHFSKDSAFTAENLVTAGKMVSSGILSLKAKQTLEFKGVHTLKVLNLAAAKLQLDAIAEASTIRAEAPRIEEAATSKLYAQELLAVVGFENGFDHKGSMKSRKAIGFKGGVYTGFAGSQTLAGTVFQNDSTIGTESGKVAAAIAYAFGDKITYKNPFTFHGCYFLPQAEVSLDLVGLVTVQVRDGAHLSGGTLTLSNQAIVSHTESLTDFPFLELFGNGIVAPKSAAEHRQKEGEIRGPWIKLLPQQQVKGVVLKGTKELKSQGILRSNTENVVVESPQANIKGAIQSGLFDGVITYIRSALADISAQIEGKAMLTVIDRFIKIHGPLKVNHLEVVMTEGEIKAREEAEKKAKAEAAAKASALAKAKKEAEAKEAALKKAKADADAKAIKAAESAKKAAEAKLAAGRMAAEQAKQRAAEAAAAVKAQKEAEVSAAKIAQQGKTLEVAKGADIQGSMRVANADLADLKGGVIRKGDVAIDAKTLKQAAESKIVDAQKVQLTGNKHTMGGQVKAQEYVQQTKESTNIEGTAKIHAAKEAHHRTKQMTVAGKATSDGQSTTLVDKLKTTPKGVIKAPDNYVEAKKANHAGEISGSNVHVKCDDLQEAVTGKIKGTEQAVAEVKKATLAGDNNAPVMHVKGDDVTARGKITGGDVSTNIKKLEQKEGSVIAGTKSTVMTGETLKSDGEIGKTKTSVVMTKSLTTGEKSTQKGSDQLLMKAPNVTHAGEADGGKVGIEGDKVKIKETGAVKAKEAAQVIANKEYDNKGKIRSEGTTHEEVPDAHKAGDVRAKKGRTIKATKVQPDVNGIWAGKHPELTKDALHLIVPKAVVLNASPKVDKDLGLVAPGIVASTDLKFRKDATLVATKDNLDLKDVAGKHVHLEAEKGKVNVGKVSFTDGAELISGQDFAFRGNFTGKGDAYVKARSVLNPLNNTAAADILFIQATHGDILNRGTMQGRKLLKRIAAGSITDELTWFYAGNTPYFIAAKAIGGAGVKMTLGDDERNVGYIAIAGNKVRNIGSHVSTGAGADAVIDGKYGIENLSEYRAYCVESWTRKHGAFKHKKTHYEHWSNVLAEAKELFGGRVFRSSEFGGFYNLGSTHAAQGEDITNVHGQITHAAFVLNDIVHVTKKKFWGAVRNSVTQQTQQAQVVRFFNNKGVYQTSRTAGISGQGTYFMAPVLYLKGKKRIHFDEVLLNNSIRTKSTMFSPTISGIPLFGGNGVNAVPGVSLYNDLRGMGQSDADVARMVAGFQQTWSQITGLANGYNNGQLLEQIKSQFGEFGFTFTKSKSERKWQDSTPTMMNIGEGHFISEEGVTFAGGTQANASVLLKVDAPEWILSASRMESSSKNKSFSFGAGFNPWTWSGSVNFGMNRGNSHGTSYRYAQVNAPIVDVGVMDHLGLYGGAINCNKIKGKVGKVDVVTLLNEFHSKQSGFNINLGANFKNGFSNPNGGFSFNFGSSHQRQANQHAGIFADDYKAFSIGQLNVTDTQLDPALAARANQVNFTRIYDVNKSHSFGLGMQGLDFSSGEAFAQGFAKNAAVLAAGAAVNELGQAMGLSAQVAAGLAMAATAGISNELNSTFDFKGPESGIGILGQLNYSSGEHQVNVTGIDFSLKNLNQAIHNLEQAAQKLFAPEISEPVMPEVPVFVMPEVVEDPEVVVVDEDDDHPALRLKTPEDKVDVEDKAAEEKLAERKRQAAKAKVADRKEKASDKGKEDVGANDDLPDLGYFGLPKAARNLVENAPLILEDYSQSDEAGTRVEMRAKRNHPVTYTIKEKMDRGADLQLNCIDKINKVLMDPDSSWWDYIGAQMLKYGAQEHLNNCAAASGQAAIHMYGSQMLDSGPGLVRDYVNTGAVDQQQLDDFLYAGQHVAVAGFQVAAGKIVGGFGKRVLSGTTNTFRKIIDFRNRNAGQGVTGFVDNPKAGIWSTARYSNDYAIDQDPRYAAVKQKWTVDPTAPFNVFTHGNENLALARTPMGLKPVNAKGFSRILFNHPEYKEGTPVHLFICKTGKKDNGFAQQLANRMNAPVFAPTKYMMTLKNGDIAIADLKKVRGFDVPDTKRLGESKLFMPQRGRPLSDNQAEARRYKFDFVEQARNLLRDDIGAGKSPFEGTGPSRKTLKNLAKMKQSPANDWTVDDLVRVGKGFGIEVKNGGKHILLKYPDGTQFGLPYNSMTVDKNMVKKFVRKVEELEIPTKGRSLLNDDSGSIRIPTKRDFKVFGKSVKDTVLDKIHEYQYKKHGWQPLVKDPRAGKWNEVTIGKIVYMNELEVGAPKLKLKENPKGPFTLVWEGARYMPFEDGHQWSTSPDLLSKYLYEHGYKHGQPVALISCKSATAAKNLSAYMNVPVLGLIGIVRPNGQGGLKLTNLDTKQFGYIETFYPRPSYQQAMIGAAGMAAGIAPLLLLRADTRQESDDYSNFDDDKWGHPGYDVITPSGEFK